MGELGRAIIAALRDQGWTVLITDRMVYAESPRKEGNFVPVDVFQEEHEAHLRTLLMVWMVDYGVEWPWPPDLKPEDFLEEEGE